MLLKHGDFIEDKFGQRQRNMLTSNEFSHDVRLELFEWYGTYILLNDNTSVTPLSNNNTQVLVRHLRGRQICPQGSDKNEVVFDFHSHIKNYNEKDVYQNHN